MRRFDPDPRLHFSKTEMSPQKTACCAVGKIVSTSIQPDDGSCNLLQLSASALTYLGIRWKLQGDCTTGGPIPNSQEKRTVPAQISQALHSFMLVPQGWASIPKNHLYSGVSAGVTKST
jgi:hypothetical protein